MPSTTTHLVRCFAAAACLLPSVFASDYLGPVKTQLTFFGFPDNCDTTGCYYNEVAYPCTNLNGVNRPYKAGGDGSLYNPLTVAYQPGGNFQKCQVIYIPWLQKYGILEGLCASCHTDHLDIWVGSKCSDTADKVCACEDTLTPGSYQDVYYSIVAGINPSTFSVNTDKLFDSSSQKCTGKTYPGSSKVRRDPAGQLQSSNQDVAERNFFEELNSEKWLKKRGACSENSCQCGCCPSCTVTVSGKVHHPTPTACP